MLQAACTESKPTDPAKCRLCAIVFLFRTHEKTFFQADIQDSAAYVRIVGGAHVLGVGSVRSFLVNAFGLWDAQ